MFNSGQERITTDQQSIIQQLPSDNLLQLVFTLPPQLLSILVICSKPIYLISQLSLIVRWSHPLGPYPSWILLFTYITLVLSSPLLLCFAIPNLLLLAIISINLIKKKLTIQNKISSSNSSHPIAVLDSLQSFQILVDHYSIISSNMNPIYQLITCSDQERSTQAIKICLTSIPFSILITYLIPTQSIILILGSILIVWSSKWFQLLIQLLWRSLLLRLVVFLLVDLCLRAQFHPISRWHQLDPSLQNIQPTRSFYSTLSYLRTLFKLYSPHLNSLQTHSNEKPEGTSYSSEDPSQDIEFCLTIFENQRWWMGLDWTSNLLPHERPNWADSMNHPVPTPANITLPSCKTFKDANQNLQRKVEWKWIDSDWKIIEAHTSTNTSKEEDNLNQDDETLKSSSPLIPHPAVDKSATGSTLNHTPPSSPNASFRRHQNRSSTSHSGSSVCLSACLDSEIVDESLRNSGLNASIVGAHDPTKPWDVDASGWQYGDNHWEKMSSKSGIGKYTRRRAWARKASLVTRLEPLQESNSTFSKEMDSLVDYTPSIISSPANLGSTSDSATALLHNISVKSSALVSDSSSPSSTSSSVSLIKNKKSFGLLRRKK